MEIRVVEKALLTGSQIDNLEIGAREVSGALVFDDEGRVVQYASEWLTTLTDLQAIAYTSAETYARNISYFIEFLSRRPENVGLTADEMLLRVNLTVLEDWIISQQEVASVDRSTIRNREGCLRSFYDFFSKNEYRDPILEESPFPAKFLSAKPHLKQVVSASLSDLVALMNESRYERERLLLQFMYDSGVRISEVQRITYRDIQEAIKFSNSEFVSSKKIEAPVHPGYAPILIRGSKGRGNSIKERFTIITAPTLKRVASYHASPLYRRYQAKFQDRNDCPAFLNSEGSAYNESSLSKMIERRSKSALKKKLISKKVHAHLFRHGSAYLMLQDPNLGSDFLERLVNVQKTLGHAFISTSERYTSIPLDIYDSIADSSSGGMRSKIEKMAEVVERTKLRIKLGDKK
ncbi:tyrosine-type recombinase/integrase [Marinobacter halotolerans]|uniref:tyrosine-type recombinase/integrase n=1 Tax=Marinobacter halotolerans TaxID=1569211 RepID=UPI0012484C0C|nr:tyrosine-type recombinase/integrase [Marinobacter halotolerans]